jgi:hypothetical protein
MIFHCKYDIIFVQFSLCFLYIFLYNKACYWSIGFLQIVNISKLYHILGSNYSTFYVRSIQVSFLYKFLVLKMQTLLLTEYMWKMITFHCFPSLRWMHYSHHITLSTHCSEQKFCYFHSCTLNNHHLKLQGPRKTIIFHIFSNG